jgi:hypothetical protein
MTFDKEDEMAKNKHVVRENGKWAVKTAGKKTADSTHRTQAAAEARAKRDLAREGGGEVVIHGRNNRIRDKNTVAPGKESRRKDKKH